MRLCSSYRLDVNGLNAVVSAGRQWLSHQLPQGPLEGQVPCANAQFLG